MKKKLLLAALVAVVAPALWLGAGGKPGNAGGTKPFKETGTEYIVTTLAPGSLPQPLFVQAREDHGTERWAGVGHQFSQNNVGGAGNSVMFETVHSEPTAPKGSIIYAMKYETVANGDRFVMAGCFVPQLDGTYVANMWLEPDLGTGRFAGATGSFTGLTAVPPNGFIIEGTITMIRGAK